MAVRLAHFLPHLAKVAEEWIPNPTSGSILLQKEGLPIAQQYAIFYVRGSDVAFSDTSV